MIKSMTGFGRCEQATDEYKIMVEMKSVNHRYLDAGIKLPKKLLFFEAAIRNLLKEYIERGKVDVFVTFEAFSQNQYTVHYNEALAASYLGYLNQMAEQFGIDNNVYAGMLSRYPDVFTMEETEWNEDRIWEDLEKAVRGACERFVEVRSTEGANLKVDLDAKLDQMLTYVDFIEKRSPEIMAEYRTKLQTKVQELLGNYQVDEARIAQEVTIYADKICVDEETVRLRSHITTMKNTLAEGGAVGRKLDFIAQEMNREANTILSKANDISISDIGINLKTDIEKVREQIQNIE